MFMFISIFIRSYFLINVFIIKIQFYQVLHLNLYSVFVSQKVRQNQDDSVGKINFKRIIQMVIEFKKKYSIYYIHF